MKKILKPKKGLLVRRPDTQAFLKEEGESVTLTTFWRRRIADGDVIEAGKAKVETPKNSDKKETK